MSPKYICSPFCRVVREIFDYNTFSNRMLNTMIKQVFQYKNNEYVDILFNPIKDDGDNAINTLMDIMDELYAFMQDSVFHDIEQALDKNAECLAFNFTTLEKDPDTDGYFMQHYYWYGDAPQIYIKKENLIEVFRKWQEYMGEKPNYIIITRDERHYAIEAADEVEVAS